MRSLVTTINRMLPAMALLVVPASVIADAFAARVDKGNAVLDTAAGEAYEKKLRPLIQQAMRLCAPLGSSAEENPGKFVLVADVSAEGKVFNPLVRPEAAASICFGEEIFSRTLPAPPDAMIADGFFPLVIEVYVVP